MDYTWMQTDFLSLNKAKVLMFFLGKLSENKLVIVVVFGTKSRMT